ncbi:MAG: ribonuclease P protein component 1 [Candidatus Aenigmatarchaeota archaeon]
MLTPKNLVKHELIGLIADVVASTNKFNVGIRGLVVDETKNTLTIETETGLKKVQKKGTTFIFKIPSGKRVKVNGNKIAIRPEDRMKIKVKKW